MIYGRNWARKGGRKEEGKERESERFKMRKGRLLGRQVRMKEIMNYERR